MYAKCSRCINVPERPPIILLFYLANFMIFLPLPLLSPFSQIE